MIVNLLTKSMSDILLVLSMILFTVGVFLGRKASPNILSSVFMTLGILGLFYVGGWIYYLEKGHVLTLFVVSVGVCFFGLGAYVYTILAGFHPRYEMALFMNREPVHHLHLDSGLFLGVFVMTIITFLMVGWFFFEVGIIFFSEHVAETRSIMMMGRGVLFRGVNVFLPISFISLFAFIRFTKWQNGRTLLVIISITSIIIILMLGSRGFAAVFVIPLLIIIGYSQIQVIRWQIFSIILIFVVVAIGLQYRYLGYDDLSLWDSMVVIFERMTKSQVQGLDHIIYDLIPIRGFYRGEIFWWDFKGLLATFRIGHLEETFSSWLWQHLGRFRSSSEHYTLSTTIVGDLYADYGLVAVASGMFFYGALAQTVYVGVIRRCKHWFDISVNCFFQYILISAHISGSIFGVFSVRGLSLLFYYMLVKSVAAVIMSRYPESKKVT